MSFDFAVPAFKKIDVIISTDAKNEADDQYAIAHALLSPRLNVRGIIASHFGTKRSLYSMEESYQECLRVAELLCFDRSRIYHGSTIALNASHKPEESEGVRFLIESAYRAKDILYVGVMGPLTDVAAALLLDETIAEKICVIWTGTTLHLQEGDICREANARNDIVALNILMQKCPKFIAIPYESYSRLLVSLSELQLKVSGCGDLGQYLFQELLEVNQDPSRTWATGESWCLGDNAVVGMLLNSRCGNLLNAQRFALDSDRVVHLMEGAYNVLSTINERYVLEDFFAKMAIWNKMK